MRERGRVRNRDSSYRLHARSGRAALSREFAGSRGRSRQGWSVDTGYRRVSRNKKFNHAWGYNRGLYKQATTFFFSNIPNDWNYNDMWTTFDRYGRLISIYSPQRRNQFGRRFGFLKYIEVRNARELEEKLDQIWVAGRKIWVNIAKYPEEKIAAKKKSLLSNPFMVVEGKSYADAVKGQEEMKYGKTGSQLKQIRTETVYGKKGSIPKNSKTEQRKIWRVKNRGTEWRGLEYNVKEEDYEWLQGCYVGIAHSVEMVPNIQEKFYIEGYFSCRLRAMGGKMVLMDCEDKEELKDLVQGAADWLGQWFSEVKPWSPPMVAKERFVWIRCQGTPLQAWGPAFFESMAVPWGKFICLDDSTSQKRRFDIARFLISTQIMDLISVKRQITVNGEVYCLKFTEEEMTNSLFSLRYDFLPSFKSDSEHEEYWSEASDYDDEWQDDEWGTNRERAGEEEKAVGDTVGHSTNDRRHAVSAANEEEFELEERGAEAGQFEKAEGSSQSRLKEWDTAEEVADSIVEATVYEVQVGREEKGREKEASLTNQTSSDPIQAPGDELRFGQAAQSKGNMGHNQNVVKGLVERQWACNKKGTIVRRGPIPLNKKAKKKGSIINLKALEAVRRTHTSSLTADKGIEDSNGMDGSNKVGVSSQLVSEDEGIQLMISKQPQEAGISAQVEHVEKEVQLQILKKKGPKGAKEVISVEKEGDLVQWEHEHEETQLQIQKQMGSKGAEAGFLEEPEGIPVQVPGNKNRKKRSKSCHSVYLKAQLSGVMIRNKEGRGRSKESEPRTEDFPEFLSTGRNSVAGDSVGDSGIENCNRILKEEQSRKTAEDLWDFAKRIGVVAEDEVGVIRDLEEMEKRDRKEKEAEGSKAGSEHKKETKMEGIDRSSCRMIWGSDDFEWVAREAEGLSGGMLCIWNSKKFKMGRVLAGTDFIGVEGAWGVEQCPVSIINVYSPCQLGKKRILWEELKALVAGRGGNWCIMGDFNAVRKVGERGGSREISAEMREFDGFIRDVGLVDLPLIGRKFTWVQASGRSMSRIDRFLLSEGWLTKWGDAKQWGLNRTVSDHCPILLKQQVVDWGPKPFKFFNSWIEQEGCRELIKETWSKADVQGWAGYRIKEKLKMTKEALRKWSKDLVPINFNKSHLIGISVEEEWIEKMSWVLCCKKGSFPFKYLGIPIGGRYGKIAFWKPLIDIFSKKLSKWKGRFLSLGGRITLINSVLDSLPVFWMSVYLIPKGTILLLDQIRRRFLWGGTEGGKKINWVKWEVVCKDKKKGGLGVKDLRKFNMAILGKWWGKLVSEEKGLWKKIIFEKYGKAGEHSYYWLREENNSGTKWWRDICRVNTIAGENRGWLSDGFNLKVGEGVSTNFWWDNWRGEGCLANKYPRLYSLSTGKDNKIPQMGEWLNGKWEWNLQWRRNLFSWEIQQARDLQKDIQDIRLIRGKPDLWEWAHSKDGTFSTNSAYQILTRETRSEQHGMELQNVWNKLIPNKISAFSWQLLQDKIPTKLNLHKRGIIPALEDCKCALCGREAENTSHLFIHCNFAWHLWNACFKWWGYIHVLDKDCWKVFQQHPNPLRRAKWKEGWECIWFGIVWTLWPARNEKIFREKEPDRRRLLELVQIRTFRWLKSRNGGCVFSLSDWLHNPTDCLTNICKQQAKSHILPKARPSLQD
ncbi:hypothetical protein SLEP1_g47602 [Rubroshorea leprosula]|uniref:RRM domain-containing protein n=1 Tax=Rubroshorea leprosula TaxID=152421 RepID=A0AAV5LRV3_9ROSI|nr:hypothetical protein SLEP1_g47602 [Rubroshorea leprosula]